MNTVNQVAQNLVKSFAPHKRVGAMQAVYLSAQEAQLFPAPYSETWNLGGKTFRVQVSEGKALVSRVS